MSSTAPMFLELDQEERERELLASISEEEPPTSMSTTGQQETDCKRFQRDIEREKRDHRGKRILLAAEKNRLMELVGRLHEEPDLVNYADPDGYTPLHRASYGGHLDCVKYLARHGANLEAQTSDDWRPLHCAVRWNNLEVAEYLLSRGVDVNAPSSGGNTPLHLASSNGRYSLTCDLIQLLLFHANCDFTLRNQSGDTAYDLAKRAGPFYKLWSGVTTISASDSQLIIAPPKDGSGDNSSSNREVNR